MRLIDADALLRELREELGFESPMLTDAQNEGIDCGLRIAIKDVKSQPTIDPESLAEYLRRLGYEVKKCQH